MLAYNATSNTWTSFLVVSAFVAASVRHYQQKFWIKATLIAFSAWFVLAAYCFTMLLFASDLANWNDENDDDWDSNNEDDETINFHNYL